MTATPPAAQRLRALVEGRASSPFEGSGSSDHVRQRNLRLSVVAALVLLALLVALLVF